MNWPSGIDGLGLLHPIVIRSDRTVIAARRRLGKYAWNLEPCEEEFLIAAYDEIRRYIPPYETWSREAVASVLV
jgi:hypothetical protein